MRTHVSIEMLEDRIAPAVLVNPTTISYEDKDGDTVTVKFSKPILNSLSVANNVFHFDSGTVAAPGGAGSGPEQLETIDLTQAGADAAGINISVTAKHSTMFGGDGYANVGAIDAVGLDLGTVSIQGDLGNITAGSTSSFTKPAIKSLIVQSIGQYGLTTQASGTATLESDISGPVTSIKVLDDVTGAYLNITGSGTPAVDQGSIGSLSIGGSLFGGSTQLSGVIRATGKIGSVKIGGDVVGGAGADSGVVTASGLISSVKIGGSLLGGTGEGSGSIESVNGITTITVAHNLRGGAAGAGDTTGAASGAIDGGLLLGKVKIGGSLFGGGDDSASIIAEGAGGAIKSVSIAGDVVGGIGEDSAYVHAEDTMGPLTIGGSVLGGAGEHSASLYAGSGDLQNHTMTSVTIGHNLQGGAGDESASIGAVFGAVGTQSGLVIGKITIKGSVLGDGEDSASITGRSVESLTIGGSIYGGANFSAALDFTDHITTATIAGSIVGGAEGAGGIEASHIAKATIAHNVVGGTGADSGTIVSSFDGIGSLTIGGNLESGTGAGSGSVQAAGGLTSLVIKGSVIGAAANPARISAVTTAATPANFGPAIGKVSIAGSATYLQILTGFSEDANAPSKSTDGIGTVTVGRDWTASSISAGVDAGTDGQYGTADDKFDATGTSKIASIIIGHRVFGTPATGNDNFGFVAGEIDSLKIGPVAFAKLGPAAATVTLPGTDDVTEETIA